MQRINKCVCVYIYIYALCIIYVCVYLYAYIYIYTHNGDRTLSNMLGPSTHAFYYYSAIHYSLNGKFRSPQNHINTKWENL